MAKAPSEVLLQAIEDSGRSLVDLAEEAGVPMRSVYRFTRGETGLNTRSFDALCRVLKLRLVPSKHRRKR